MKFRRNPLPRRTLDLFCFFMLGILLPVVSIFEVVILLPVIHKPGSLFFSLNVLIYIFLLYNIEVNLWATMIIDTSVNFKQITSPPDKAVEHFGWRYCDKCDCLTPPRSWHCRICKICILKRDHHCLFTGCCIGHRNQRHFICFTFYILIGSAYAIAYLVYYLLMLDAVDYFSSPRHILKTFLLLDTCCDFWIKVHRSCLNLLVIQMFFAIWTLVYHGRHILQGQVCSNSGKDCRYNNGWYRNLKSVFGQRMHLVWLCPLVKSPLPENGYNWESKKSNWKSLT